MKRPIRILAALVLGAGMVSLPQLRAADEGKGSKAEKPKPTDWSGVVTVATIVGEVVNSTQNSVTVRVSWVAAGPANGGNGGGNNNARRPQIGGNNGRQMANPFMRRPGGGGQQRPQTHVEHHDYSLAFAPNGLVRNKTLPPKTDDNGKTVPYKTAELEELRLPPGAPGYAASPADLANGTIAEFVLVRDRDIPAAKATESDLKIKYAMVVGKNPNPSVVEKKKN